MLDRVLVAVTDVLATTPGVMFCVKDAGGKYVSVNQAFAERSWGSNPGDVVGRTVHDLFPPELATRYAAQDAEILETGRTMTNELELITRPDGTVGWFLTSKARLTDAQGNPAGIVSASVDLRAPADRAAPYPQLAAVVDVARRRFADQISVRDLALVAEMSQSQFERTCRRVLGLSPKQLIMRFRIEEALRLLRTTDTALAEIAPACGYYDQSAFTRHFRRVVGYTPAGWRTVITERGTPPRAARSV